MIVPMMLEKSLPEALMAVVIVLVLSASMSTLSSLVLVSSSAISLDLLKGTLFPKMKKELVMVIMRMLCVIFVILSLVVALTPNAILTLMSFSWGTIAGAFLAPFVYGLYWKGTTKSGAWAGFITGFGCSIGGTIIYGMNPQYAPNIGAVSMLVSLVVVPAVSLLSSKLAKKDVDEAYGKRLVEAEADI